MPYYRELRQPYPNELYHHGIKGQKWGVRRFQNPDGTFTEAGKRGMLILEEALEIYTRTLKSSTERKSVFIHRVAIFIKAL